MKNNIIEIKNLNVSLKKQDKRILKNINLKVKSGDLLGIMGASGSGKTTLLKVLTSMLDENKFNISGEVKILENNLSTFSKLDKKIFCSSNSTMILQDAINSLNPYEKISKQLIETYKLHNDRNDILENDEKIEDKIINILKLTGLENYDFILNAYPNQLSGGMRQRVSIALSLCCHKIKILYADEPTTSLDVINQYKFINFLKEICLRENLTLIYVSHDIRILMQLCDRVIVMNDGEIIEDSTSMEIWNHPKEQYTKHLIDSVKKFVGDADE